MVRVCASMCSDVPTGPAPPVPRAGSVTTISWTMTLMDSEAVCERQDAFTFTFGDADTLAPGLEIAVGHLGKGQTSVVQLQPAMAHGDQGLADCGVPPDAAVQYTVTLVDFHPPPDAAVIPDREKLQQGHRLKAEGNAQLKGGRVRRAVQKYEMALYYINDDWAMEQPYQAEVCRAASGTAPGLQDTQRPPSPKVQ